MYPQLGLSVVGQHLKDTMSAYCHKYGAHPDMTIDGARVQQKKTPTKQAISQYNVRYICTVGGACLVDAPGGAALRSSSAGAGRKSRAHLGG